MRESKHEKLIRLSVKKVEKKYGIKNCKILVYDLGANDLGEIRFDISIPSCEMTHDGKKLLATNFNMKITVAEIDETSANIEYEGTIASFQYI